MALDPELSLFSYTFEGDFVGEFTARVLQLETETIEGSYRASWSFEEVETDAGHAALRSWFYNRLMTQVKIVYKGEMVWSGYIWEMELDIGRMTLKRSMTDVANALAATHSEQGDTSFVNLRYAGNIIPEGTTIDENDNRWLLADSSIQLYGRQEKILDSNGSDGEALALMLIGITSIPDPYNYSITYKPLDKATLRVTAVGRMVIANKTQLLIEALRYHPDYEDLTWEDIVYGPDDEEWTVGAEVQRIVDVIEYTSGWLYAIRIAENDTPTKVGVSGNMGAFDRLVELTQIPNSDGEKYQLRILDDGGVIYDKYDETVMYVLKTPSVGIEYPDGTVPKWQAKPGIIQDISGGAGLQLPTSWLTDPTLIPTERVTMRDGDDFASFTSRTFDPVELQSAMYANLREYRHIFNATVEEDNGRSTTLQ